MTNLYRKLNFEFDAGEIGLFWERIPQATCPQTRNLDVPTMAVLCVGPQTVEADYRTRTLNVYFFNGTVHEDLMEDHLFNPTNITYLETQWLWYNWPDPRMVLDQADLRHSIFPGTDDRIVDALANELFDLVNELRAEYVLPTVLRSDPLPRRWLSREDIVGGRRYNTHLQIYWSTVNAPGSANILSPTVGEGALFQHYNIAIPSLPESNIVMSRTFFRNQNDMTNRGIYLHHGHIGEPQDFIHFVPDETLDFERISRQAYYSISGRSGGRIIGRFQSARQVNINLPNPTPDISVTEVNYDPEWTQDIFTNGEEVEIRFLMDELETEK